MDEGFAASDLTRDAMLGGAVVLCQPRLGYRAGSDPVLLAAACNARSGQSVLELGCGAAPALCCLGKRMPDLDLAGIEIQGAYAELARRNLAQNDLKGEIWTGDLAAPPSAMKARSFDHVIANPPYFETGRGLAALDAGRDAGRAGALPLEAWVQIAARRLKPRGHALFIIRSERLPELMAAMAAHLGGLELLPLVPRPGRAPRLVLLRGRKEGRAPFIFHPPCVLHPAGAHRDGAGNYTPQFQKIMNEGAALAF